MNSKSKLPSLSEYEERIFRKKDIACLFYLDFLIQLKVLNFQELKLVLKLLQRIYEKHLEDFRFLEFYSLGLVTKIVTLYEINDEIISGCSISFTDALTNGDVEFKMQAAVGYFEIIHLHYYLLNEEYIRSSFMYLNTIYKKENDEDTKDYILRVFKRMAELELIPADLRVDFYNEMYKELMSKKEKGSEEVIKILNFFHDQKLPIDHARPDELIDLLKLIALNTNGNKLQTSLQGIRILMLKHESFSKRQDLFGFILSFLSHQSSLIQNEALSNMLTYFLVPNYLNEEQKTQISSKLSGFQNSEDPYIKHHLYLISKHLSQSSLPQKIPQKRKFNYISFPVSLPFDFPIKVSSAANESLYGNYVLPLDRIRQKIKNDLHNSRIITIMDMNLNMNLFNDLLIQSKQEIKFLKEKISSTQNNQNDPDIRYLTVIMNNYLDFPRKFSTNVRFKKDNLISYFEALYISRETANVFTYESFQKLLNKLINFRDEEYISQTLNLILRMLNSYPTDFYVSFEEETKLRTSSLLLNNINNYYLDSLDIVIANQRQRFLNMNEIPIEDEHPILSDARILMSLGASEQTTIPEKNYQYMAISDLLQGTKLNGRRIDLSIRRLIKYRAHIVSPGLIYFELNIPKLDSLIADGCNLYNEYLAHKLKQENYLDEGRNIHTKVENDEGEKEKFILACITYTKEFVVNMLPEFPLNDNALRELLDEQLKTANEARKTRDSYLQGFVLKDAISLLFVLQKEKWKLHRKYKDILFPVKVNQDLRLAIRSLTQLALQLDQLFPIPTTTDVSSYKKAEELAVKLISRLEKNKTLIIPSGMPIKMNEKESKHFFYILIKNCGEKKYKLIIVNGGDNLENAVDADKSFVAADVNMPGNNWLCRETNEIDLNIIDQKRFTKEYIHRALLLPYTQINKADPHYQKKNLMDNINLISEKFLGFGFAPTVYKPEVVPVADRKYSMPSQLFGNCTVFNLQFALRFMFDWNEAQFTQFIHDSYLRYNNFLHRRVEKLSLTFKDSTNPGGADVFSSSEEANYTAQILTERNPQRRRAYSI